MYRYAIEYLRDWKTKSTRKPLVVRGARQVGKSHLVGMFGQSDFENILELNFEYAPEDATLFLHRSPAEVLALLEAKYQIEITPGKTLLFLDEIQSAPEVFAELRYFYEQIPELHIIAAGSLLDFMLEDHKFSMPVGRIEYLHLGPMNFEEFLMGLGRDRMLKYLSEYQIGQEIPLHKELIELVKQYWIVGGMPAVVGAFAETKRYRECDQVKQSILATYRDDFSKYARRFNPTLLGKIFTELPTMVGQKFVYSHVDRDKASREIKVAFDQLCLARVVHKVRHSDACGVPVGSQASERNFKAIFLDVGLQCRSCGLSIADLAVANDITLINSGSVAEQFVGQHLLYSGEFYEEPELYCWMRQKASSNAEVDYLLTQGQKIVPVEVKAGKVGSLKSLQVFINVRGFDFALRFNADIPSVLGTQTAIPASQPTEFRLLSLPFYLIGQARRLCREVVGQ